MVLSIRVQYIQYVWHTAHGPVKDAAGVRLKMEAEFETIVTIQ